MYFYQEHIKFAGSVGFDLSTIRDIEHFRVPADQVKVGDWFGPSKSSHPIHGYVHIACIVLKDGFITTGVSKCSEKDQYNRKMGYGQAVQRALKDAFLMSINKAGGSNWAFDQHNRQGVELRDYCRVTFGIPAKEKGGEGDE